jgi:hypothetical protein
MHIFSAIAHFFIIPVFIILGVFIRLYRHNQTMLFPTSWRNLDIAAKRPTSAELVTGPLWRLGVR